MRRSLLRDWLPVGVWAAAIFGFSSVPSLESGLEWDFALRKVAHFTEYLVLGALLARALRGRAPLAVTFGIAYAISDELHQHFVAGRSATLRDVVIDGAGVVVGALLTRRYLDRRVGAAA